MQVSLKSTSITKSLRCISLCNNFCKQNEKAPQTFLPIYKFPYIRIFSLINRLKLYQTALAVTSVPGAIILNYMNYIPSDAVQFTAALGVSGCLTLHGLGYFTSKFIGFIYYNEENDEVKISYVDFWGKRKDIEIPVKDVVPINDLPVTLFNGLFVTFQRFSTKDTLRINLKYGIILDKGKMGKIL